MMSNEPKIKNMLLIALGGSGRKLGVTLLEKIKNENSKTPIATKLNCKLISIDFRFELDSGFYVDPKDCFFLTYPGINLTDLWADFERRRHEVDVEEPWMKVGPISEIELFLARDAQQSGIRRVDYELLVYKAREQIHKKLRETLLNSFPKASDLDPEIHVIVLGSLAGRTGSLSYPVVFNFLGSLALEFNLVSYHAFLYSPSVFQELFYENDEQVVNFLASTTKIRELLTNTDSSAFKPMHFLMDEYSPLLSIYRDWQNQPHKEVPYSESIEMILKLIQLDTKSKNGGENFENWFQSSITADQSKLEYLIESFTTKYRNYSYQPYEEALRGSKKVNYEEIFINLR